VSAIYLDYAATSPVDPAVAAEMLACLGPDGVFANPSSTHAPGQAAAARVEAARAAVAQLVNAAPERIFFTSGATEANNLALKGLLCRGAAPAGHLVTSRIEHRSVLDPARALAAAGLELTLVDSDASGFVEPDAVAAAIRPDTTLVSIMHVNNEIGTVQDIAAIAALCHARGVPLHVDAAQSAGKLPLDLTAWAIDLCSLTAHKLNGPKGVGALYVRPGLVLAAQQLGGAQERSLRAGTLATHQIAGMGKAFELADPDREPARIASLRERFWDRLAGLPGVRRNTPAAGIAPHILNLSFEGAEGESLRLELGDIAVSAGSACTSDSPEPSHVLVALGLGDTLAHSSLRFGFGRFTTAAEVDEAARRVREAVLRLRGLAAASPAWCRA
jgi:cysteine desulfurase